MSDFPGAYPSFPLGGRLAPSQDARDFFNEDGTGEDLFWALAFTYQTDKGTLYIDYEDASCDDSDYTYSIDGDVITMTRNAKDAITMLYRREPVETQPETETEG